jgi:hypothetical protein
MVSPYSWRDKPTAKITNVDHLLHFTLGFRNDLPRLNGHQSRQIRLGGAQGIAESV